MVSAKRSVGETRKVRLQSVLFGFIRFYSPFYGARGRKSTKLTSSKLQPRKRSGPENHQIPSSKGCKTCLCPLKSAYARLAGDGAATQRHPAKKLGVGPHLSALVRICPHSGRKNFPQIMRMENELCRERARKRGLRSPSFAILWGAGEAPKFWRFVRLRPLVLAYARLAVGAAGRDGWVTSSRTAAFCRKPLREKWPSSAFARLCPLLPAFARLFMGAGEGRTGEAGCRRVGETKKRSSENGRLPGSAQICPELPACQQNIFSPRRDSTRGARDLHSKTLKSNH